MFSYILPYSCFLYFSQLLSLLFYFSPFASVSFLWYLSLSTFLFTLFTPVFFYFPEHLSLLIYSSLFVSLYFLLYSFYIYLYSSWLLSSIHILCFFLVQLVSLTFPFCLSFLLQPHLIFRLQQWTSDRHILLLWLVFHKIERSESLKIPCTTSSAMSQRYFALMLT